MEYNVDNVTKWAFNLCGRFEHHKFFTKELWRKIDGFKHKDKAEVHNMFMHKWFYENFGIPSYSVGVSWFCKTKQEYYDEYIKEWLPVINAYDEWKNNLIVKR